METEIILFTIHTYIHTYIITLQSELPANFLHNYVLCVNFIHERQDLQLEVNTERQIFEKLFNGNLLQQKSSKDFFQLVLIPRMVTLSSCLI